MPKAYLTVLFFDERFNFVEEGSVSERVLAIGDMPDPHDPAPLDIIAAKAPKNGYAYIYVSNESDEHVYFDNLQVTHERGRLIEENHYYAYGLKIAGISSRKLNDPREGHLKNFYQYQGEYSEWDEDLGWTDFFLRSYDAQTGRFWQMDPYDEFPSPFTGMGNDPINFVDPSGGCVTCLKELQGVVVVASRSTTPFKLISTVATAMSSANIILQSTTQIVQSNANNDDLNQKKTQINKKSNWEKFKEGYGKVDRWVGEHGGDWINENLNPLTPILEFITGKEYKGGSLRQPKPRLKSFSEAALSFTPLKAGKVAGGVVKGAAGNVLKLAKKYGLNANSPTTRQLLDNFDMRAADWLAKFRKGSVKSQLGDVGEKTIGQVFEEANSTTRKMIMDGRFAK